MAVSSLGIGITITVKGNFEKRLKSFQEQMNKATDATDKNTGANKKSTSHILKTAAAFGILGTALNRSSRFMFGLNRAAVGFFGDIINEAAQFQESMLGIEVFFGADSETLAGKILDIANASDVALTDVTNIARRLGSLSLPIDQTAATTDILTQALSTLAGQDRTRALNGVSNIMTDMNSAAMLLNTSFNETEKAQFQAAQGTQKQAVLLELLEKRFGRVNQVMSKGFLFGIRQVGQLFAVMKARIGGVFLANKNLIKSIAQFVGQLNELVSKGRDAGSILNNIGKAFAEAMQPVVSFFQFLVKSKIIPRFLKFLGDRPALIKNFIRLAVVGTLVAAVILKISALMFLLIGSILLFKSIVWATFTTVVIPAIGAAIVPILLIILAVALLAGAFKAALGPTMTFIMKFVDAIKLIGTALFQAFSQGRIQTELAEEMRSKGLLPLFRILITVGSRLFAFFKGVFDVLSTMGPEFTVLFDELGGSIKEIIVVIQNMLVSLGLMSEGGVESFGSMGAAVGKFLKFGLTAVMSALVLTTRIAVALVKIFVGLGQIIAGVINKAVAGLQMILGLILKLPFLSDKTKALGESLLAGGIARGDQASITTGSGINNLNEGFSGDLVNRQQTSDPGQRAQDNTPLAPAVNNNITVKVGPKDVNAVVEEQKAAAAASGSTAP